MFPVQFRPALAFVEMATEGGYEGPNLVWYLLTCILVIGGICGLGLLVRRVLARAVKARAAKRSLQVLDVLPLGGKQKLVVVRCYDRSFLLGLGDKEVRSIAELDEEPAVTPSPRAPEESERELVHPPRPPAEFVEVLRRSMTGEGGSGGSPRARTGESPRRPVLDGGRGILG